jgi:hypothetical protein
MQRLMAKVAILDERLAQYEPEIRREGLGGGSAGDLTSAQFSVDAEKRRRRIRRRRKKKSPGWR